MSEKIYSYAVFGMVTGEHYIEDLKLRIPHRSPPIPITEEDFINSKDLDRAVQQKLVKVISWVSVPSPMPTLPDANLERKVEELSAALTASEAARKEEIQARKDLEAKIEAHGTTLNQILLAVQSLPASQGGLNGSSEGSSEVVGGEIPMFIPENIPSGDRARITLPTKESTSDIGEAAQKLRQLRKSQGGG